MSFSTLTRIACSIVVAGAGLTFSACNTTKATFDSTVKFFSSTSPENLFTVDGLVKKEHKLRLFTDVEFENLQQDIARGDGEHLASLGVLLDLPQWNHQSLQTLSQGRFASVFASGAMTPKEMRAAISEELNLNAGTQGSQTAQVVSGGQVSTH